MRRTKVLQVRKAQVLKQIAQERDTLQQQVNQWQHATASVDRGWQLLLQYKHLIITGTAIVALNLMSGPFKTLRWGRRLFSAWSTFSLFRRLMKSK